MDYGVASYTVTILSGTEELTGLQGTIYANAQITGGKIKGTYEAVLSFDK
jgi:hypothetical protein